MRRALSLRRRVRAVGRTRRRDRTGAIVAIALVLCLGTVAVQGRATADPASDPSAGWTPGATFELGVDSFSQIFRITDDLSGGILDTENSFRDTTDVFTELRAAAAFSMRRESPTLRTTIESRLSTGTELDREAVQWDLRWHPAPRDRIDLSLQVQARQFRENADFSLDSDNQEGLLRLQWQREAGSWHWGLKARSRALRFDTRSIYELDSDRLDLSAQVGWRQGWRHWVDVDAGIGRKDVRDSTAISYDHLFARADAGWSLSERWQWQLRPSVERRFYDDAGVRHPFWDLDLDSQLEWRLGERWRLRWRTPLEYLRPDENTDVYFDIFSGRIGSDLVWTRGLMEIGVEPRWSWLRSSLKVEDSYSQPSVVLHFDHFGSERWWLSLSEELGRRSYVYDTAGGLDLYSDYFFVRTSLLGGLRLNEHLSFELFLSDEPESHRRGSDDSRLTLVSAALRAGI
jgi:hypothetical protein